MKNVNQENAALSSSIIRTDKASEPLGPYPHARRAGNLLFLSGFGPRRRGSPIIPGLVLDGAGNVVSHDIEAEMRSTFENVTTVLAAAGATWDNIIDCAVYLTNMREDWATYNRVYAEYFPPGPNQPTRTTVEVSRLPQGGDGPIHFEIKIIASVAS